MLRTRTIAKELQISERQLASWMSEGIIPYYKVGRLVFLDLKEVYEAIRRHGSRHRQTVDSTSRLKGRENE